MRCVPAGGGALLNRWSARGSAKSPNSFMGARPFPREKALCEVRRWDGSALWSASLWAGFSCGSVPKGRLPSMRGISLRVLPRVEALPRRGRALGCAPIAGDVSHALRALLPRVRWEMSSPGAPLGTLASAWERPQETRECSQKPLHIAREADPLVPLWCPVVLPSYHPDTTLVPP